MLLTRRGKVTLAGLLVVIWFEVGLTLFLFTLPGGLSVATLPAFYLFVEPELFTVSLLPAWNVFLVVLCNNLLIWMALLIRPHTAELDRLLQAGRHRMDRAALGLFPLGFAPRRPRAGRRTPGWGQAIEHGPGTTRSTHISRSPIR